ncbi:MAG: nucleotidyltransferase domain-containing protein [candidate division WOR-3 bacterium]|nr:nucleotidyltransferase domain-containing protein [candidate division WOR-3 bacterium]
MAEIGIAEVIDYLSGRLRARGLHVEKLVLFGSHARGRADDESDIDLAVVSGDFRNQDIFARVELTREAEMETVLRFIVPMDLVLMTPEEYESRTSPVAAYAREGKVIYEAQQ